MKRRWTEEEVSFLKFAYKNQEFEINEICEALDRSESSIRHKAKELLLDAVHEQKESPATKVCTKCGEEKNIDEFNKMTRNKDGKHPYCKSCHRESTRLREFKKHLERGWY